MFDKAIEALKFISDNKIAMVDLKVAGLLGQWLHVTLPARKFTQRRLEEGVGYDGSSGSGFTTIESGDVVALPVLDSAFLDPFWEVPTLSFICNTVSADTKEQLPGDPRTVLQRALEHMRSTGIADQVWMAPEFEFHILDRVHVCNEPLRTCIEINSSEIDSEGLTPRIPAGGGYMRVPPVEHTHNIRSEMVLALQQMGVEVKYHHHEVGAAGQCEIEIELGTLPHVADHAMLVKYVVKNIARKHNRLATFMPKPLFGEPGNGMHVHQRLTLKEQPLFYDPDHSKYAHMSSLALQYIGGLLRNGPALCGLTNPSTNSYKRLVEGYEAPVNLFYSLANRSAAIRIPKYAVEPGNKRIEYRPPDFTGNIYLTLAGMLMAGLDGITSNIDLAQHQFGPFDVDISKQDQSFKDKITALPRSLDLALDLLQDQHDFLRSGEVFPESLIQSWIQSKRKRECEQIAHRPHPYEYQLYLDV